MAEKSLSYVNRMNPKISMAAKTPIIHNFILYKPKDFLLNLKIVLPLSHCIAFQVIFETPSESYTTTRHCHNTADPLYASILSLETTLAGHWKDWKIATCSFFLMRVDNCFFRGSPFAAVLIFPPCHGSK